MIKSLLALPLLTAIECFSQSSNSLPSPVMGWDSLEASIPYGEIMKRAGLEGAYRINVTVDSLGQTEAVAVEYLNAITPIHKHDSAFVAIIAQHFPRVFWNPANRDGMPIRSKISIPIVFYLNFDGSARLIIRNTDRPVIQKNRTY